MNSSRNFISVCTAIVMVLAFTVTGDCEDEPKVADKQLNKYDVCWPTSWHTVRNSEAKAAKISMSGYLSLEGFGDFPDIRLYQYKEDLDNRDPGAIRLDMSACRLINDQLGWGADNWAVLDRLFVEVHGELTRSEVPNQHLWWGMFENVTLIGIKNNGLTLMAIKPIQKQDP